MIDKICHISSVHAAGDPRIRLKEVRTAAKCCARSFFVTGDLDADYKEDDEQGLRIIKVFPGRGSRFLRILITSPACIIKALRTRAEIYHIHDPELLLWVWLLRIFGAAVVYDVHEDYVTAVSQKSYIPRMIRSPVAKLFGSIEGFLSKKCVKIIAEQYYEVRFPSATSILNYPILKDLISINAFCHRSTTLIYTGNVTPDRGSLLMTSFDSLSKTYNVHFIGRCSRDFYEKMSEQAAVEGAEPPAVEGVGRFVEFSDIIGAYGQGNWLAGIAVFPDTEHYREKELTKFFEYMAVGLPIIASDFPVWKKLIEDQGVGICVPPGDNTAIEKALDWLKANPQEALEMSRKGKELAMSKYSWESQAEKLINLYQGILDQKKNPNPT